MKNTAKRICALMMALTATAGFAACDRNQNGNADLVVTYYNGGYGEEWLEKAANAFEKDKGVKVKLIDSYELDCDASNALSSGRNLSDIYISADSEWSTWVTEGKLEPLGEVYDTEVDTAAGKKKIKDYIEQDVVGKYYMQMQAGQGSFRPWVMPWSAQPGALAYNEDLLTSVVHTDSGYAVEGLAVGAKWTAPPETVTELKAYFADVTAHGKNYVPFGWAGNAPEMFYYMIYSWWAQAQGVTESKIAGEGSFYDFWNFGNDPAADSQTLSLKGYEQTGIKTALDTLRTLIVKDGTFVNSLPDATGLSPQDLQRTFVSAMADKKPAIALASSYLENETDLNGYLDSNGDGKQDVNFKFMKVPVLDGYTGENTLYCSMEDVMFIPAKASHKELAKEFLAYLCSEAQLKQFSAITGGIRPFAYDAREGNDKMSAFTKSVYDLYYGSTKLFEYPHTVENMEDVSNVYRFARPTLLGNDLGDVVKSLKNKTGATIMSEIVEDIKELSVGAWEDDYQVTFVD